MASFDDKAPLTEPVVVASAFCAGVEVETTDHCVRVTGWEDVSRPMRERRIVARMVLPPEVAHDLVRDLRRSLARGGH